MDNEVSRYFTLREARDTLAKIRPLMDEIQSIREDILERQPEFWPAVERSAGNGGSPALSRLLKDFDRLDALIHRIQDEGVLIKDLTIGLLDFPHMKDGREIYLCWKYGEDAIDFWHEVESGFAGRQPIDWG
ncbi:MAG TPA: DUF2203 domain-containing protein [Anaerolineales bacterium]|jgi:hypothetical protein